MSSKLPVMSCLGLITTDSFKTLISKIKNFPVSEMSSLFDEFDELLLLASITKIKNKHRSMSWKSYLQ